MTVQELVNQATVPLPGGYHTWPEPLGKCSANLEDCELLYALVRVLKPKHVLETGTGLGVTSRFIAEALKENGRGDLETWDPLKEWADQARRLLEGHGLPVTVKVGHPRVSHQYDLVFIDSGPGIRAREIRRWLTSHSPATIVVHDANRRYDELSLGTGGFIGGADGFWIGRAGR